MVCLAGTGMAFLKEVCGRIDAGTPRHPPACGAAGLFGSELFCGVVRGSGLGTSHPLYGGYRLESKLGLNS